MPTSSEAGVYPNPSASKSWTDHAGRVWQRRGERGEALEPQRVRRLLRRNGVPLATWGAGIVEWYDSAEQKQAAADSLYEVASRASDVFAVEWKSTDGLHMLMLEHHC